MGDYAVLLVVLLVILVCILLIIALKYESNPFALPIIRQTIDISRRRQPSYFECVEQWVIDYHDIMDFREEYEKKIADWDEYCKSKIDSAFVWKSHLKNCYNEARRTLDVQGIDYPMFQFAFVREQKRYRQTNNTKEAYQVSVEEQNLELSLRQLLDIDAKLCAIGYETTLEKYNARDQRKQMTVELRREIIKRDNYTCQICGKYMPDEVGLQVDHIVPIKKGGKTVASNLQVLCSKCNGRKSAK